MPAKLSLELSGAAGSNRSLDPHRKQQIVADNDLDAIAEWIRLATRNENTARSYAKEAYRFLLWAITFKQKPISSLYPDDLRDFEAWLARPDIPEEWRPEWRVILRRGLKADSMKQAMRILQTMCDWMCGAGYLNGNPFRLIAFGTARGHISSSASRGVLRYLDPDIWAWLVQFLDNLHHAAQERLDAERASGKRKRSRKNLWPLERCERLRFMLIWIYRTAVRRSELANAVAGDVQRNIEGIWVWWILGKGDKDGDVLIDDVALAALTRYRRTLGLAPYPEFGDRTPLLLDLEGKEAVPDAVIYRELKAFFKEALDHIQRHEPEKEGWVPKIKAASTHWLRHTRASHLALGKARPKVVQDQLRHSDPGTTGKYYIHVGQADRLNEIIEADSRFERRATLPSPAGDKEGGKQDE